MVIRELPRFPFDVRVYQANTNWLFQMEDAWYPLNGVSVFEQCLHLQNLDLYGGTSPALVLRAAVQMAAVRQDRPDDPPSVATGSDATTADTFYPFSDTLSTSTQKFWFRRGVAVKLTTSAGVPVGRASGALYGSFRTLGDTFPTEQILVQPGIATNTVEVHPLRGGVPISANSALKARFAIIGMGSVSNDFDIQAVGRAYNDPLQRGDWSALGSATTASAGNFYIAPPSTEIDLTSLVSTFRSLDLGISITRSSTSARATLYVTPSVRYS